MNETDKKQESQLITRIRAFAVLMIVAAHCNKLPDNSTEIVSIIESAASSFSSFGVWLFFCLGGYLFAYEKRTAEQILMRKAETLILPWAFTGTMVYLYTYFRHGGLSVISYFAFLIGYGSYLWYMTVFVILLLVYTGLRHFKHLVFIPVVCGVIMALPSVITSVAGDDYNLYYHLSGAWPVAFGSGFLFKSTEYKSAFIYHL